MKVEVLDHMGGKLIRITQDPIKIDGLMSDPDKMEILIKYVHNGSVGGAGLKIIK